jgi:hypothetical protein
VEGETVGRYAIFVDAGYLLSGGGWATVASWRRGDLVVEYEDLIGFLCARAANACEGKELLRVYWYDAGPSRQPDEVQLRIGDLPDTKLRMGHLTSRGGQKGVDGLILADLMELARLRAIETAVLIAGDGDLLEAVTQAQRHGVRVLLWGVTDTPQPTVSPDLRREADRFEPLRAEELAMFFGARAVTQPVAVPIPAEAQKAVAATDALPVYAALSPEEACEFGRQIRHWLAQPSCRERRRKRARCTSRHSWSCRRAAHLLRD